MWLLPVVAGAVGQAVSVFWFERLRPGVPYPLWSFVSREPGRVRALRVGGVALAVFGALVLTASLDRHWYLAPILIGASFLPTIVAIFVVNGRFVRSDARATAPDEGD